MSEFIITSDQLERLIEGIEHDTRREISRVVACGTELPEVVRCRDCKFYTPESMTREERGFGVYENMWEPGGCFNPERCSATWDSIAGQMVPVGIVTEPDGYCAWGERRADA